MGKLCSFGVELFKTNFFFKKNSFDAEYYTIEFHYLILYTFIKNNKDTNIRMLVCCKGVKDGKTGNVLVVVGSCIKVGHNNILKA